MKKIYLTMFVFLLVCGACQKDPEIGGTNTEALAGEWFVKLYDMNNQELTDYFGAMTYNTAANDVDKIWFSDKANGVLNGDAEVRLKIPCNVESLTFGSAIQVTNAMSEDVYVLNNGKIILKGATSPGGYAADSIRFEFTDKDGTYIVAGFRRTGWAEDEF